ncbi:MAG: RsmE family RNA methyltransferase [Armatimonadota bacterium]|nr:RsmE family RNA methyltransferase [Armatimonadota bacterium]
MNDQPSPVRLRRFYVPPAVFASEILRFEARESHHIATVLRLAPGTRVTVFDGRAEAEAELIDVSDAAVTARRVGTVRVSTRPMVITLLQGVARGPKMDLIVRTATEIGVSVIAPVVTSRSLANPGPARCDRWRRIAREAARQCGRPDIPHVEPAAPLPRALETMAPSDIFLVPWEHERRLVGSVLAGRRVGSAVVLIGPEGGLTDAEVAAARGVGGQTVSLGPLILRTETAGLVTVAMLVYEGILRPSD